MNRLMLMAFAAATLSACALHEIPSYEEATNHYRSSERYDRIAVKVFADQESQFTDEGLADLANMVADELVSYLGDKGMYSSVAIGSSTDIATARIVVTVIRDQVPAAYRHPAGATYRLAVSLVDPYGNLVDKTTLYHRSGDSPATSVAQQLAMLVADDMLLMWHPAASVVSEKTTPRLEPARYTLLANSFDPHATMPVISWEPFPSERLITGADFSAEDITDVSYELRLHGPGPTFFPDTYSTFDGDGVAISITAVRASAGIFQVAGITEPQYAVPITFPSCEYVLWSVRAHFRLHGHPRVTEWAGNYSTKSPIGGLSIPPPYYFRRLDYSEGILEHQIGGGTLVAIEPPAPLKCKELGIGWIIPEPRATLPSQMQLGALKPGHSIAAITTMNDICTAGKCEVRASAQEASEKLAGCLDREFNRRSFDVPVHDMLKILSELPAPPNPNAQAIDGTTLLMYLRLPENRDYLDSRGIRYVVSTDMSLFKEGGSWVGGINVPDLDEIILEENYQSMLPIGGFVKETHYVSSLDSDVIDISKGEVVGTIASTAEGDQGAFVPVVVIIPVAYIPYGSRARIEAKACDQMARRLSITLRGAVSGWPEGYFKHVYSPLWKPVQR